MTFDRTLGKYAGFKFMCKAGAPSACNGLQVGYSGTHFVLVCGPPLVDIPEVAVMSPFQMEISTVVT